MSFHTHQSVSAFQSFFWVAVLLSFAVPSARADSADEARAVNRQVLELIKDKKLIEARALAEKGLALCEDAGSVKGFCIGQFSEFLGDIAFDRGQHADALRYFQDALRAREQQPSHDDRIIALTQLRIGRTQAALHQNEKAEDALQSAVALFARRTPADGELGVALIELAKIYISASRAEAVTVLRRAIDFYVARQGPTGQSTTFAKRLLGAALINLGNRQANDGNYVQAEQSLREAVPLFEPPLPGWERSFAIALVALGKIYELNGRYADAEPYELRALEYSAKSPNPNDPLVLKVLAALTGHYDQTQQFEQAAAYAQRIISVLDGSNQDNPTLASALIWLGRAQNRLGRYSDADATYGRALRIIESSLPEDDSRRANIRIEIGLLRLDEEQYVEAEQEYRTALALSQKYSYPDSAVQSAILAGLSVIYRETGKYSEAERAVTEAIKIDQAAGSARAQLVGERLLLMGTILRRETRYLDAEKVLLQTLNLPLSDVDHAQTLNSLGLIYTAVGQYPKAELFLTQALAIQRRVLPIDAISLLDTETNLAEIDLFAARFAEAVAKRRDILTRIEQYRPSRPSAVALHTLLLANALVLSGKLDEAETLTQRAIELYEKQLGQQHPRTAGAFRTLASIDALRGNDHEAEAHYRRALAADEQTLGQDNAIVAGTLASLAPILQRLGKRPEAKADLARALAILNVKFGSDGVPSLGALWASANLAYEETRYKDARDMADRVRGIRESTLGPNHPSLVASWIFAARVDVAEGRLDAAKIDLDRAADIVDRALPAGHPFNVDLVEAKADLAFARGDLGEAEESNRQALAIAGNLFGPDHLGYAGAVERVVNSLWARGKRAEAQRLLEDELAHIEQRFGDNSPVTARALRKLADTMADSAHASAALVLYQQALKVDENSFGPKSREAALDYLAIGLTQIPIGEFDQARTALNRARSIGEANQDVLLTNVALRQLALLAAIQGYHAEAAVLMQVAVKNVEGMYGSKSPAIVTTLAQLGRSYLDVARTEDAHAQLQRIIDIMGENPSEQAPGFLDFLQFQAMFVADRDDVERAEGLFKRAISLAGKYGGPDAFGVAVNEFNLARTYLKAERFDDALTLFKSALEHFRVHIGDHGLMVGYALAGAASAYAGKGDQGASAKLRSEAIDILGPTIGIRPQLRWL